MASHPCDVDYCVLCNTPGGLPGGLLPRFGRCTQERLPHLPASERLGSAYLELRELHHLALPG